MARFHSHFNTAKSILKEYMGEVPFSAFIKLFFAKEKKYGSRDRRVISSLCYNYFRLGAGFAEHTIDEKILAGLFFLSNEPNDLLQTEKPEWNNNIHLSLSEKLKLVGLNPNDIFPLNNFLSPQVDVTAFNISFLLQPDVFIRVRPSNMNIVKAKLSSANVWFRQEKDNCLVFPNGTKLEEIIKINKEAVIQDLNSQRVGDSIPLRDLPATTTVWDCCAASGGKSIMAYDVLPKINLTVSDIRSTIIHNLQKRLVQAEIKGYRSFVVDLTNETGIRNSLGSSTFDLIICDAPCSGSGTWSRTPEQLTFFKEEEIIRYAALQQQIVSNTLTYVKKAGYFLYITCSVFEKENEEAVRFILKNNQMELLEMQYLEGYHQRADSMFVALFRRNKNTKMNGISM